MSDHKTCRHASLQVFLWPINKNIKLSLFTSEEMIDFLITQEQKCLTIVGIIFEQNWNIQPQFQWEADNSAYKKPLLTDDLPYFYKWETPILYILVVNKNEFLIVKIHFNHILSIKLLLLEQYIWTCMVTKIDKCSSFCSNTLDIKKYWL